MVTYRTLINSSESVIPLILTAEFFSKGLCCINSCNLKYSMNILDRDSCQIFVLLMSKYRLR